MKKPPGKSSKGSGSQPGPASAAGKQSRGARRSYQKQAPPAPPEIRSADAVAEMIWGPEKGHWLDSLNHTRALVDGGEMPPALGGLDAIRAIYDGAMAWNEELQGSHLAISGAGKVSPEQLQQRLEAIGPDELIPIPIWVADLLVSALFALQNASKDEWGTNKNSIRDEHTKLVAAELFGAATDEGRGGRGYLQHSRVIEKQKRFALEIAWMLCQPDAPSLTVCQQALATYRNVGIDQVREAWALHRDILGAEHLPQKKQSGT